MKVTKHFQWSNGFKWRGENYIFLLVLFGRAFSIRKPRWLAEHQDELDGRYYNRA